ncbi:MAG: UDP-glucose/GDP-mannose dehydrogenase family protein, partial [Chthoniobacterales bacterium]
RRLVMEGADGPIVIIGLSFKKDTDDLRNSPMVALAEGLLSEGRRVTVYDPLIKKAALVGANLAQISRRIPHFERHLTDDLETALACATTVVVSHPAVGIDALRKGIRRDAVVIDVNGWPELAELDCSYQALCW